MVTNYYRGRAKEYKVMSILRNEGWVCSRSAMSHGPVDVFAAKDGEILVIQVKSGKARIGRAESVTFVQWAQAFGAMGELWQFRGRKGLERRVLHTNGNSSPLKIRHNGKEIPAIVIKPAS